jgi:hypothetical protein
MTLKDTTRAGYPSGTALLALILVFLLAEVRPLLASPGAEFTVSGSGVVLRAQPRETANALLTLTTEHLLVEFARQGDWVRVGVYREVGAFGWVPADQLGPAPRPPPAAVTPEPLPPVPRPLIAPLLMEITGTPAVDIKGTCTLLGPPGGERRVKLVSQIPKSYSFRLLRPHANPPLSRWRTPSGEADQRSVQPDMDPQRRALGRGARHPARRSRGSR